MDRQNVAYDLSMYESLLEPKHERQARPQQQAKTVKLKNKRAFKTALNVLSIAVMVSMIIGIVYTNSQITEITTDISTVQKEITELESEKAYLDFTLESRMSLNEIEDYAVNVLGMVKMDSTQVEYIEIESENMVEFSGENFGDKIEEAVQPVLSYFAQ
jgi:cell division protein FtsL